MWTLGMLFEGLKPVFGAILVGVIIGILVPGQKQRPWRRAIFGIVGGVAGYFEGVGIAYVFGLIDAGLLGVTVLAVCALLGAFAGSVLTR